MIFWRPPVLQSFEHRPDEKNYFFRDVISIFLRRRAIDLAWILPDFATDHFGLLVGPSVFFSSTLRAHKV